MFSRAFPTSTKLKAGGAATELPKLSLSIVQERGARRAQRGGTPAAQYACSERLVREEHFDPSLLETSGAERNGRREDRKLGTGAYFLISFLGGAPQRSPGERIDGCAGYLIPGRAPFHFTTGL